MRLRGIELNSFARSQVTSNNLDAAVVHDLDRDRLETADEKSEVTFTTEYTSFSSPFDTTSQSRSRHSITVDSAARTDLEYCSVL